MKIKTNVMLASALLAGGLFCQTASAHVVVTNDKLYSAAYSEIGLAIPHGCEGYDTVKVEVSLPEGLSGVRPIDSVFGKASVESNDEGAVTKITWTRVPGEIYASDSHAYNLSFRTKIPDAPFKMLYFPTIQSCEDSDGNAFSTEWVGMGGHDHSSDSAEKPAPSAMLYPARTAGWNQYNVNEHVHDLSVFNDAEIVWMGDEAYSANPHTYQLIQDDASAKVLEMIHPGSVIWVKY